MDYTKQERLLDALEQFQLIKGDKLSPLDIISIIKIVQEIYDCPPIL